MQVLSTRYPCFLMQSNLLPWAEGFYIYNKLICFASTLQLLEFQGLGFLSLLQAVSKLALLKQLTQLILRFANKSYKPFHNAISKELAKRAKAEISIHIQKHAYLILWMKSQ